MCIRDSRIGQVLEEQPAFSSPEQPVGQVRDGSVDFDRVFFKYKPEAQEYALSDVSLSIKAGQTVGVLGGTGSAKTTLVQLIPRLYDASRGTCLLYTSSARAVTRQISDQLRLTHYQAYFS